MPLDLQPVDEEESTLDLQPVEEAAPVPSPERMRRRAELTAQLASERRRALLPQAAEFAVDAIRPTVQFAADPIGALIRSPYELDRALGLVPKESPNPLSESPITKEQAEKTVRFLNPLPSPSEGS